MAARNERDKDEKKSVPEFKNIQSHLPSFICALSPHLIAMIQKIDDTNKIVIFNLNKRSREIVLDQTEIYAIALSRDAKHLMAASSHALFQFSIDDIQKNIRARARKSIEEVKPEEIKPESIAEWNESEPYQLICSNDKAAVAFNDGRVDEFDFEGLFKGTAHSRRSPDYNNYNPCLLMYDKDILVGACPQGKGVTKGYSTWCVREDKFAPLRSLEVTPELKSCAVMLPSMQLATTVLGTQTIQLWSLDSEAYSSIVTVEPIKKLQVDLNGNLLCLCAKGNVGNVEVWDPSNTTDCVATFNTNISNPTIFYCNPHNKEFLFMNDKGEMEYISRQEISYGLEAEVNQFFDEVVKAPSAVSGLVHGFLTGKALSRKAALVDKKSQEPHPDSAAGKERKKR